MKLFDQAHSQPFELVLVTRNAVGDPTGKRNCVTDNPYTLSQFYLRHKGKPRKKSTAAPKEGLKVVKQHGNIQSYVDTTERDIKENVQQ